jgi:hypothetical protein
LGSIIDERKRRIKGFTSGYLFQSGLITIEQLDSALERQLELTIQGRALSLGEVLVEMGIVTRDQLNQAQTRQWTEEIEERTSQGGRKGEDGRSV